MKMHSDKRCQQRIAVTAPVVLTHQDQTYSCKLLNISLCGVGILSQHPLKEKDHVFLELTLPNHNQTQKLKLVAEVMYCSMVQGKHFIGLLLNDLDMHQRLVIKEFSHFHQQFEA